MQDVVHMATEADKNADPGSGEGAINVLIGNDVGEVEKTEVSRSDLHGANHQIGKDHNCKRSAGCWTRSMHNIIDAWQTIRPRPTRTTTKCTLYRERTRLWSYLRQMEGRR